MKETQAPSLRFWQAKNDASKTAWWLFYWTVRNSVAMRDDSWDAGLMLETINTFSRKRWFLSTICPRAEKLGSGRCCTASGDSSDRVWYVRLQNKELMKELRDRVSEPWWQPLENPALSDILIFWEDQIWPQGMHSIHYTNISRQMEASSNQVTMEGPLQPPDIFWDTRKGSSGGCCSTKRLWGDLNASCFLSLALIWTLIRNKGRNPEIPGDWGARLYKK